LSRNAACRRGEGRVYYAADLREWQKVGQNGSLGTTKIDKEKAE
jgi:hypothetical protein